MPPRFAYWTIILEGKPTAFRAQHREDLVPTFKQLQGKHPDVQMMWFGRGRLWASPEEARAANRRGTERRKPDWRPGGEHRDPRARFDVPRDEKRRRFAAKLRRDSRDRRDRPANRGPRPPFKARDDRDRRPWPPDDRKPFRDKERDAQESPERKRSSPQGFRPKGRDDRAGGDRPKRFTPKPWRNDRGRGPKSGGRGGRGGGRSGGGHSR